MKKMFKKLAGFAVVISLSVTAQAQQKKAPYLNPALPIGKRVADLMSRMTLNEKVGQLMGVRDGIPEKYNVAFFADTLKAKTIFGNGVNSSQPDFTDIKETVATRNAIQKYLAEKTRLGIPTFFVDEGQHGLMKPEATCFPMAIGLACSWDAKLFKEVYTVVANEMSSRGTHHVLSPVIDVCRDPRWGRVEETYGEDPYLNGILGTAAVIGFQGSATGYIAPGHVAATLKHFVGHGQPEGGINQAPGNYSERVLREFHMPQFKTVIDNAHPLAIMPSYNEVDGKPSHNNSWLLKNVLRNEWHFKGMITSDYSGITQLFDKHLVANDNKDAAMKAFNAGVECEFPTQECYKYLPELVKEGKVKIADIDKAVYKVLYLKFQLGLFENPYVDLANAVAVSKLQTSRDLALKAAHESIVLLKNQNNLLPLQKGQYKKIAVMGPCSNNVFTGGYSGEPYQKITILDGIKSKVGVGTEVLFAQGCKIVNNLGTSFANWQVDNVEFTSREENLKLIEEAVGVAKQAEIVIIAIGETEHLCREDWSKTHLGDAHTLDLFGEQEELVKAIVATGKPVIVYLMNGRPLAINWINKNVPAILEGWYMGQETGTAAANIIFGEVNPSGKLTITVPTSAGQLPVYYNHKPSAQYHNYVSQDVSPLYPFGFGLSYTTFSYSNCRFSSEKIKVNQSVEVSVDVTNTGKIKGDEIVQLYVHDLVASVTRPVMELKGFERISLEAGETKTVKFSIDKTKLAFWDYNMKYTEEPGAFDIMVGKSSTDFIKKTLIVE